MRERESEATGMWRDMHSADRQRDACVRAGLELGTTVPGRVIEPQVRTVPKFWRDEFGGEREIRP